MAAVTMRHAASQRTQRASREAFENVWRDEGWVLVDDEAESAEAESEKSLDDMKVPELKQYAEDHGIDLGDATKKDDIRAAIELAEESGDE